MVGLAIVLVVLLGASPLGAQEPPQPNPPSISGTPDASPKEPATDNSRILGVLPNYLTVENSLPYAPIPARRKLKLSVQESFDWPLFLVNGGLALIYQAERQNPSFGYGAGGYAKRYAAVTADGAVANLFGDGILPALLHQDPRFFRRGAGSVTSRLGFALKQVVVARSDSGKWQFATSEILGNAIGAGAANIYYPDSRTLKANLQRFGVQIGNDAIGSLLEEFWPDIRRKFFQRHQ